MKTKDRFSLFCPSRLQRQTTTLSLAAMLWALNASGQILTTPPDQNRTGEAFSSTNSNVVTANAGGTITLTGGTVTLDAASGGQVAGLLATGDQAKITATSVGIVNNNNQGSTITFGVNATSIPTGAATVTLSGGTIVTSALTGGRAYGINSAVGGTVDATDVEVTTNSANSHGVVASGGSINLTRGLITTNGQFSLGLQANSNAGSDSITANGTTITTFGATSAGADAEGSHEATISLTNVIINTSGASANGLIAIGSGNTITATNTNITTNDPSAAGAVAFSGGQIQVEGGTIKSNTGLAAAVGSQITADNVTVTGSTGASADTGGTISISNSKLNVTQLGLAVGTATTVGHMGVTNTDIVLNGPTQSGPHIGAAILNAGSTLTLTGGSISDTTPGGGGRQSIGLRAENGATLTADGTNISGGFEKSAEATSGGHIELSNLTISQNFDNGGIQHGALEVSGGSTISTDNVKIQTGQNFFEIGAFAQGGTITLKNSTITTPGTLGAGLWAETATFGPIEGRPSRIDADNVVVTTSGPNAYGAIALFGAIVNLNSSMITTTGGGANGVYSFGGEFDGSTVNVTGSSVTAENANAGQVVDHSVMSITDSTLTGGTNGIRISDDVHALNGNPFGPDTLTVSGSTLTAAALGAGQAAIRVEGAEANITLNSVTVNSGAQNLFLNVTSIDRAGAPFASIVDLFSNSSTLPGDVLADADSNTNVFLEHHSTLNGAVNENNLTGATHLDPNELIPPTVIPPQTVNLGIDSTSTWNMRASSTLNTLFVNPQAHINFADPPADPFKTLVMNNLVGTGGIFGMNVDLGLIKGDLINILTTSEGRHLLTFVNRNQGSDLPVRVALLVVRTPDGGAGFRGEADGGTFRYFVVHGDGSSVTPVRNDWYLVRGDEIKPPQTTEPPPTNPDPTPAPTPLPLPTPPGTKPTPPEFTPGDSLPLPPEPAPRRLSLADDLTSAANAAIGTFSATMPLFYADMGTLIERMGELRLQAQEAPPPTAPIPSGISKEGGKAVVAPPPPAAPPAGGGVWVRGFGSGSHINDQVSRSFDQDLGGFQIGADKRLVTRYGDLYLGGFFGYFYAHRDFSNQPFNQDATGTTNAFSVGGYSTLIHPSGFYADLVVKYTQLWNDFDAPNFVSALGLGPRGTANYSIPTFGGSLEIGKRWDFGHFFLEPQGQIEGAWAGGTDYTVSTGLRVSADSQTSLRGRLGVRTGFHFDWGSKAFEPYAKVSVINEFLGGDRITTNQTAFFPTLSGVGIQAAAGLTARITDSFYIYGEYDYANSDKTRMPWAVDAGLRWVW